MLLPFALLVLAIASGVRAQIPDTVVLLDEATFEHHTQASTGQTAGYWFVLFNAKHSARKQAVRELWVELAQDEDKEVIFAEVMLDDHKNKRLARQFEDIQPPAAVLFRDRLMFVYPSPLTTEAAADDVRRFWKTGYQEVLGVRVPPRPGIADLGKITGGKGVPPDQTGFSFSTSMWGLGFILLGIGIHAWAVLRDMREKARARRAARVASAG